MKFPSFLPWRRAGAQRVGVPETKATGFVTLTAEGRARWSSRSYASLAREGFMKNPVAHRAVRMIAEAAASVPWLVEALYGHLLLSGNAFVEGVRIGPGLRELHLLRPDRMRVIEGRDGWPEGYEYRVGGQMRRYPVGDGAGGEGDSVLARVEAASFLSDEEKRQAVGY